ncbi:MAG: hypothetical protein U0798_16775 [Gemmataceae bacterium]
MLNVPAPGLADRAGRVETRRRFGGLGLMIDAPRIVVEATFATEWHFSGSLADRARQFQHRFTATTPLAIVANGPPEHVGLGVGTALGMAFAEAVSVLNGVPNRTDRELATLCGRGERSGIGVSGFRTGGFIVDRGKRDGETVSDCQTYSFPSVWRIVVARPKVAAKWSGDAERAAFARPRMPEEARDTSTRLETLLNESIVPALIQRHFASFARGLTEYNRQAGEPFAADQGGVYSSPNVTKLVERIQQCGVAGVGQSSWGPSVFAIVESEQTAQSLAKTLADAEKELDLLSVDVTTAAKPAAVEVIS